MDPEETYYVDFFLEKQSFDFITFEKIFFNKRYNNLYLIDLSTSNLKKKCESLVTIQCQNLSYVPKSYKQQKLFFIIFDTVMNFNHEVWLK